MGIQSQIRCRWSSKKKPDIWRKVLRRNKARCNWIYKREAQPVVNIIVQSDKYTLYKVVRPYVYYNNTYDTKMIYS